MWRLGLVLVLLVGTARGADYDPLGSSVNYSPIGRAVDYDPIGIATPSVVTPAAPVPTETPSKVRPQFGRDRAVIVTATWCVHCPKQDVKDKAKADLTLCNWKVGNDAGSDFQFLDADDDQAAFDALLASLELETVGLPFVVKVEGGKIVRRWEKGCTTPFDAWTLGWLYKGIDERPVPKIEAAKVNHNGRYPLTGGWWSVEGVWNPTKSFIVSHLMSGMHRGKFSSGWLQSLSLPELQSLHTDDHTGRIKWQYVGRSSAKDQPPRKTVTPPPIVAKAVPTLRYQPVRRYSAACPTGNCPYSSQRRYRG